MKFSSRVLIPALLLLVAPAIAQDAPQQALEAANAVYTNGDYPAAAQAYEALLRDYPTSTIVPNAQVQLAFSYYLTGENQKSLDILGKFLTGPPSAAELSELAAFLEPQALSGLAASLKADDPARKTNYEEAVKKFAAFNEKYPQSSEVESAFYGSAIASFQVGDYTAAQTALETNLQRFPNSPGILDSQNLLALIFATEGSKMLGAEGADQQAAFALYTKSAGLLRAIIEKKTDLALVNTAQFQLGEILLNEAAFAPDDRKPALLEQARNAFRGVLPKETIVALQQKKSTASPPCAAPPSPRATRRNSNASTARPSATAANSPNCSPAPTKPSPPCKKSARATSRPDNTTNRASSSPTSNRS